MKRRLLIKSISIFMDKYSNDNTGYFQMEFLIIVNCLFVFDLVI